MRRSTAILATAALVLVTSACGGGDNEREDRRSERDRAEERRRLTPEERELADEIEGYMRDARQVIGTSGNGITITNIRAEGLDMIYEARTDNLLTRREIERQREQVEVACTLPPVVDLLDRGARVVWELRDEEGERERIVLTTCEGVDFGPFPGEASDTDRNS